jgi:hypothetical protein
VFFDISRHAQHFAKWRLVTRLLVLPHPGAFGASWVLQRICSCMPRPEDSGGPPRPRHLRAFRVAFCTVKNIGIRDKLISKLFQLFRRIFPHGFVSH